MINGEAMEAEDKLRKYQNNTNSKFDIDLDFGVHYENSLAKILSIGKVEVKTERDKWKKTGNIAIELSCEGNLSGLNITEADWWAHILTIDKKVVGVYLWPVDKLKEIVKQSVKYGEGKVVFGGDNKAAELALIPFKDLTKALYGF